MPGRDPAASAAADWARIIALAAASTTATTRAARASAAGDCPGRRRSAVNRQIKVADPVTSASTPSPIANTPRLWPCSPVITDTVPDSTPKATEIQTSRSAAVICPARAGPGAGRWLPGMEPSCLPGSG